MRTARPANSLDVLPAADWFDRYEIRLDGPMLTPRAAADRLFGDPPGWVTALMGLRNRIVGWRACAVFRSRPATKPAVSRSWKRGKRCVLGFDDRHLDFRIVVETGMKAGAAMLGVTTLVRRHNRFGRLYIAAVAPFHRRIVTTSLQALQPSGPRAVRTASST